MAKLIRYFLASDGVVTVFRQSPTKVYASASWALYNGRPTAISFSSKPLGAAGTNVASVSCREITKATYGALVAAKMRRGVEAGRTDDMSSPQDSWVWNGDLLIIDEAPLF